jgi:hypothetical protein
VIIIYQLFSFSFTAAGHQYYYLQNNTDSKEGKGNCEQKREGLDGTGGFNNI